MVQVIKYKEGKGIFGTQRQGKAGDYQNEEGKKSKEKRERMRRREAKDHLGSPPRRRADSGFALWPYAKSINSRDPLDF